MANTRRWGYGKGRRCIERCGNCCRTAIIAGHRYGVRTRYQTTQILGIIIWILRAVVRPVIGERCATAACKAEINGPIIGRRTARMGDDGSEGWGSTGSVSCIIGISILPKTACRESNYPCRRSICITRIRIWIPSTHIHLAADTQCAARCRETQLIIHIGLHIRVISNSHCGRTSGIAEIVASVCVGRYCGNLGVITRCAFFPQSDFNTRNSSLARILYTVVIGICPDAVANFQRRVVTHEFKVSQTICLAKQQYIIGFRINLITVRPLPISIAQPECTGRPCINRVSNMHGELSCSGKDSTSSGYIIFVIEKGTSTE